MKRILCCVVLVLTLTCAGAALAHEDIDSCWSDKYIYSIHADGTACINSYWGLYADVVIPSVIDGHTIVSVSEYGLDGDSYDDGSQQYWKSITLPETVTTVYDYALSNQDCLTEFAFPNSVTSIGACALWECPVLQVVTIPASVEYIGADLASHSRYVGFLVETDSYAERWLNTNGYTILSGADDYVFIYRTDGGSPMLSGVRGRIPATLTLPATIDGLTMTEIFSHAFYQLPTAKTVIIPEGVTVINEYAFSECESLTSVQLPESLTTIGDYSFSGSRGVKTLTIPASVTSIGVSALDSVGGVIVTPGSYAETYAKENGLYIITEEAPYEIVTRELEDGTLAVVEFRGALPDTLEIPAAIGGKTVTVIGDEYGLNTTLTPRKLILPETVTAITGFYGAESLEEIELPDSLLSMDDSCFGGTGLTSIVIPSSISEIPAGCFEDCTALESVTLPDNVRTIYGDAFNNCLNLSQLTMPGDVWIGENVFDYCSRLTLNAPSGSPLEMYARLGDLRYNTTGSASVVRIPEGTRVIEAEAFLGDTSITSIILPNSVTTIESRAFAGCTNLKAVCLSRNLTSLAADAFDGCSSAVVVLHINTYYEVDTINDLDVADTMIVKEEGNRDG